MVSSILEAIELIFEELGYENAMRIKNAFIFMSGLSVGGVIMQHVIFFAFKDADRDIRATKAAVIKVNGRYKTNPQTTRDFYDTVWALLVMKIFRKKTVSMRNVKLGRTLMVVSGVIALISITIGFWFMLSIVSLSEFMDE